MADPTNALKVENVSHAYGANRVLDDISLTVAPGQVACLLGPSGGGKSTLLRLIAGLEIIQGGAVTIGGRTVADAGLGIHLAPEKRGMGLMFQDYALFPHLTILENIAFGISVSTPERMQWVNDAIERIGLADHARSYPHTLSGGQQQRAALLRALAPEPRVLLLDEPFSGLDATLRASVRERTLSLLKETGVTTLIVTHNPVEAMVVADHIQIMVEGKIVQDGTQEDIYYAPANAFVASLFAPINRLRGVVKDGCVDSPIGCFRAPPPLADGMAAEILIRPEGMVLEPATGDGPNTVRVISSRLLGRWSQVLVSARGPDGRDIELDVRVPGAFLPEPGSLVSLSVDEKQSFVFSAA